MPNSTRKGKRGERQFCRDMRELGFGAYRSAQHMGVSRLDGSADVITSIEPIRFEIKNGYNDVSPWSAQFHKWIEKAKDETPEGKHWVIAWSPDRAISLEGDWLIVYEVPGPEGACPCLSGRTWRSR